MSTTIKIIFKDLFFIYKRFFSWFLIKIKVFLLANIFSTIFILPIILIWLFYIWSNNLDSKNITTWTLWNDNFINFLMYFTTFTYAFFYFYYNIFFIKYYLKILEKRQKINFEVFKNFLNIKMFLKYVWVSFLLLFIFWIITLLLIILLTIFIKYFWFNNAVEISSKVLSIPAIIFLLIVLLSFYLFYRLFFSYAFIVDKEIWVLESLKLSYNSTYSYKKFIKTCLVTLMFLTIYFPFYSTKLWLERNKIEIEKYVILHNKKELSENDKNILQNLEKKYSWLKIEEIEKVYKSSAFLISWPTNYINIFSIIEFIFFFWIWSLVYTSIYLHIIKKQW